MNIRRLSSSLVLAVSLAAVRARAESTSLPDTPAGRRVAAYVEAFNSGDAQRIREFNLANLEASSLAKRPMEDRLSTYQRMHGDMGSIEIGRILEAKPESIRVAMRTSKNEWFEFAFELETSPEQKLRGIRVQNIDPPGPESAPAPRDAAPAGKAAGPKEVASELEALLDKLAAEGTFSGTVLLAKNGQPLLSRAYGLADREKGTANRMDTRFNLASMNKMFTAVAIAQLASQGKLAFTDTVGKFLPDYPNATVRDKVTVHQLLTHTSGLGTYWNERYEARREALRTVKDYLALFADEPLLHEPGAQFEYSNSGFVVLGAIVEKVSGVAYDDYLRDHVFGPAGMKDTGAYEKSAANLAIGYTREGGGAGSKGQAWHSNADTMPRRGGPAGGGYSTAADLLRFDAALRSHKLLDANSTDIVLTGKVPMGPGIQYGYGFGVQAVGGKRIMGHNGGAPGVSAWLDMFWDDGYTLVVLSNVDRGAFAVERRAMELITGRSGP